MKNISVLIIHQIYDADVKRNYRCPQFHHKNIKTITPGSSSMSETLERSKILCVMALMNFIFAIDFLCDRLHKVSEVFEKSLLDDLQFTTIFFHPYVNSFRNI